MPWDIELDGLEPVILKSGRYGEFKATDLPSLRILKQIVELIEKEWTDEEET